MENRRGIMVLFSILLISGFLITSLASYLVARDAIRTELRESALPLTSDNIYSEIQRDLLQPLLISSVMAHDTFLRDWVTSGEKDTKNITRYLNEIMRRYKTFTAFFVSDATHHYYHPTGILKTVRRGEERDIWYFRVRDMDTPYEINVDPDMANQDAMTIFVNYRVFDFDEKYIGATGVGLTVSAVKKLIEDYQRRYARRVYFADRQGNIVLHSNNFPSEYSTLTQIPGLTEHLPRIYASSTLSLEYYQNQELVFSNIRYLPDLKWYLIVEQNESTRTSSIREALLINLVICVVLTILVLLCAHLVFHDYQKRLETMATTDKLTGCYNRQVFDLLFVQARKVSRRSSQPLSVIMMDVDWFKKINDNHGHLAGDAVLAKVAELMRNTLRESDIVCRWGGEEFLALLPNCDLLHAGRIAEAIRADVAAQGIGTNLGTVKLTASFGVAVYQPEEEADMLLKRADDALYLSKRNGRNRVQTELDVPADSKESD